MSRVSDTDRKNLVERLRAIQAYGASQREKLAIAPEDIPALVERALTNPDPELLARVRELVARSDLPRYRPEREPDTHYERRVILSDRGVLEIRDVKVNDAGEVLSWSPAANHYWGVDLEDLRDGLDRARAALERPVLVETELPGYTPNADPSVPNHRSDPF